MSIVTGILFGLAPAREVLRRTRSIAGVQSVAMSTSAPLARDTNPVPITIEGRPNLNEITLAELIGVAFVASYVPALRPPGSIRLKR